VHSAAVWLRQVKDHYGERLKVEWHCFPLEQVNSIQGPDWKLWDQPDDYSSRSLWAFRAGKAALRQGAGGFERFHIGLLRARHEDGRDIADRDVLAEVAQEAGLDVGRFKRDLADRRLLAMIGEDCTRGEERHGVWGTPTLVFNGQRAAYVKLRPVPPAEEAVSLFEQLFDLIHDRSYVIEVKRPR
jgi:predicted DsbA family dithiol-disulfide isomerase